MDIHLSCKNIFKGSFTQDFPNLGLGISFVSAQFQGIENIVLFISFQNPTINVFFYRK